ncbi:hypothetical protein WA158_000653 [Blastocystis sp. Blastoise]
MFIAESYTVSLILSIITMLCWGSNMNAAKNLPYSVSYYNLDFVIWCFIWIALLSLTMGMSFFPPNNDSIWANFSAVFKNSPTDVVMKIAGPALAGLTNIGTQIVQFSTIDSVGLSSGIPLLFGIAMVFGVFVTYIFVYLFYIINPKGKIAYMASGVCIIFLGVICNTVAYSYIVIIINIIIFIYNNIIYYILYSFMSTDIKKKEKDEHTSNKDIESATTTTTATSTTTTTTTGSPSQDIKPSSVSNNETKLSESKEDSLKPSNNMSNEAASITPSLPIESTTLSNDITKNTVEIKPSLNDSLPRKVSANGKVNKVVKEEVVKKPVSTVTLVIISIVGAVCNACWGPFTSFATMGEEPYLSAYSSMFIVCLSQLIFVFPLNLILMKCPLSGRRSNWSDWAKAPMRHRWPLSGLPSSSPSVVYALSRGIMLIAALWGLFYYREFKNASPRAWTFESFTIILYILGVILICLSSDEI